MLPHFDYWKLLGPPSVMNSNFYYFDLQGASEASSAPLTAWVFGMALRLDTPPYCGCCVGAPALLIWSIALLRSQLSRSGMQAKWHGSDSRAMPLVSCVIPPPHCVGAHLVLVTFLRSPLSRICLRMRRVEGVTSHISSECM